MTATVKTQPEARWTTDDLALFPDDDYHRYEIIEGQLLIHDPTDWRH